jgi:hypothetical protein
MKDNWKACIGVTLLSATLAGCLTVGFPVDVSTLLAGVATWSLCVIVLALGESHMRLAYRQGVFIGGILMILLVALSGAKLIGVGYSSGSFEVVYFILALFGLAVNSLVGRAMFTAAERNELRKARGMYSFLTP